MKNTAKIIAFLFAFGTAAQAQVLKIGIVNMQDVLMGYYKSKQAQVELNKRSDEIKKDLEGRSNKLKTLTREIEDLAKIINDESTTQEYKRLKAQELENKRNEGRALERDLQQLAKQKDRQLRLELDRTFRGIRDEVKDVVDKISKDDGYDLVFDKSAVGLGGSNFLLFSKDAVDFTASVLTSLNKDAPADLKNAQPANLPAEGAAGEPEEGAKK